MEKMSSSDKIGVTLTVAAVIGVTLVGSFFYNFNQLFVVGGPHSTMTSELSTNPGSFKTPSEK